MTTARGAPLGTGSTSSIRFNGLRILGPALILFADLLCFIGRLRPRHYQSHSLRLTWSSMVLRIGAMMEDFRMATYYVNNNRQPNGDHEVHVSTCYWLRQAHSVRELGEFAACFSAVAAAKRVYPTANGCAYCAPACHTR